MDDKKTGPSGYRAAVYQFGGAGSAGVIRARAGTFICTRAWPGRRAGISSRARTGEPLRNTMRNLAGVTDGSTAWRGPGTTRSGRGKLPGSTWMRAFAGTRIRTRTWPGRTRSRSGRWAGTPAIV